MKLISVLSTILLTFFSVSTSFATENSVSLFYENDMGYSDKYATNSLKFQYTNLGDDFWLNIPQFALLRIFVSEENSKAFQTVSVGQNMNVPRDIGLKVPPLTDRPYAGWLYLNMASHIAKENALDTFAITMGIVGRHSYAGDIQCWWHDIWNLKTPMGWDNQLEDEFGFVVSYKHSHRVFRKTFATSFEGDFILAGGTDLGNVIVQGYVSVLARFGYALPFSFDTNRIAYVSASDVVYKKRQEKMHAFLSAGIVARFVGHDIVLDGNVFANSPYGVSSKWFVAEPMVGASLSYCAWQTDFTLTYRTKEFKTQSDNHHIFWSATLKYSF